LSIGGTVVVMAIISCVGQTAMVARTARVIATDCRNEASTGKPRGQRLGG